MTRNGKIARLPLGIRQQLNQRLLDGQQGKLLVLWLNEGYDGSKNLELTWSPFAQNRPESASIGLNRSESE